MEKRGKQLDVKKMWKTAALIKDIIDELTVYALTSTLIELVSCWVFGSSLRHATTVRRVCFSKRIRVAVKKMMNVHDKYTSVFFIYGHEGKHTRIFDVLDIATVFEIFQFVPAELQKKRFYIKCNCTLFLLFTYISYYKIKIIYKE